jgi:glycosyltransferase involved in cell wall biosynthesis
MAKIRSIGIDGRCLEERLTGIGRYVYELCHVLDRVAGDAEFFVYSRLPLQVPLFSERWHSRVEPRGLARRLKSSLWLKTRCRALARPDNLEVFWGSATLLPRPLPGVRTVCTVHDLNFRIAPQTMSTGNLWAHRLFFERDVLAADAVLTNSRATAARLRDWTGREADAVVQPGVCARYARAGAGELRDVLEKFRITTPYFLSVATFEPRKNLELLVRAFLALKAGGKIPGHTLVIAGGRGWKDQRFQALLGELPDRSVLPLGYVEEADLPALYSGAEAFLFPSLYEGFGMPLLESRACGTPFVATDLPELRESGGADGIYIPATEEGICRGMLAALGSDRLALPRTLPSWEQEGLKLKEVLLP